MNPSERGQTWSEGSGDERAGGGGEGRKVGEEGREKREEGAGGEEQLWGGGLKTFANKNGGVRPVG